MVRPTSADTMSAVDGYDDLARLGWLKLSEDETSETCTEHDVPPTLEHCLTYAAVATDGGEYSSEHECGNLCIDDKSCYSSKLGCSTAVNVTAKHCGNRNCTIEAITIRTPLDGYNSPVGQVIVFASLGVPHLEKTVGFDTVHTEQDYQLEVDRWAQQAHADPSMPKPVAFVSMRGRCRVTVPAAVARSSKYVVIKLLRPKEDGDNIDVEYVGLHGWTGRRCCPCRMPMQN